ncbi:MAG: hypothetical protein IH607_08785 [Firmicutes bacterium]|nr:hypothetical protein [Bacillota bacterium]
MQHEMKWRYYNHAIIPRTAPHADADVSFLQNKNLWSVFGGRRPLLARWTSDFDCKEPTDWWYMIKDTPFDIMDVKKNYRRKIRKGLDNFDIRLIDPTQYAEELYQVHSEAVASYPSRNRPTIDHDRFVRNLGKRRNGVTIAAFSKEDNSLAGYLYDIVHEGYISGSVQKSKPSEEIKHLNAALGYSELMHFSEELAKGYYIVAGERNVLHETNIQEYLENYFGYRKAYCRLNVVYRPGVKQLVAVLYPLRRLFSCKSRLHLFCQIYGVLKMEEIARRDRRHSHAKAGSPRGTLTPPPIQNAAEEKHESKPGRVYKGLGARRPMETVKTL